MNKYMHFRRPSPLLKSPSCDSESSDQNQSLACGIPSIRQDKKTSRLTTRMNNRALFGQYRTDSETTDDQTEVSKHFKIHERTQTNPNSSFFLYSKISNHVIWLQYLMKVFVMSSQQLFLMSMKRKKLII